MKINRQCILETKTMMEGPMPVLPKGPIRLKPSLETILEVSSRRENAETKSNKEAEHNSQVSREATLLEEIPKVEEQLASSLRREVREKAEDKQSGRISPPFPFMDTFHPLEDWWVVDSLNQHMATRSLYREPNDENIVGNKPIENKENNEDLEGVIAGQVLSSLVT